MLQVAYYFYAHANAFIYRIERKSTKKRNSGSIYFAQLFVNLKQVE